MSRGRGRRNHTSAGNRVPLYGRRPRFIGRKNMLLALTIGGTSVKMGLSDDHGALYARKEVSVCFDGYQTPVIDTVIQSTTRFLARHSVSIRGVGGSAAARSTTVVASSSVRTVKFPTMRERASKNGWSGHLEYQSGSSTTPMLPCWENALPAADEAAKTPSCSR